MSKFKLQIFIGLIKLLIILVSVCMTIFLCGLVINFKKEVQKLKAEISELSTKKQQLENTKSDIEKKIAILNNPDLLESIARKEGYIKEGEVPIVIKGFLETKKENNTQKESENSIFFRRFQDFFKNFLRW